MYFNPINSLIALIEVPLETLRIYTLPGQNTNIPISES